MRPKDYLSKLLHTVAKAKACHLGWAHQMLLSGDLVITRMMDWGREWLKIIILWQSCESRNLRVSVWW